jgi:hypothetical protein
MAIVEKWEYKIIANPFTPEKTLSIHSGKRLIEDAESMLNKLGAEGWEFMPEGIPVLFGNPIFSEKDHYGAWRRKVVP